MTNNIKKDPIDMLYQSKKTVFSLKDLSLYWRIENPKYLKTKTRRLVKSGRLLFIRKGFYALEKDYDRLELANKMITPSYVGLATILYREGVIFQYDSRIYSVADESRTIQVDDQIYVYRRINNKLFFNPQGLKFSGITSVASLERAVVDILYLEPDFYFDNLDSVDWNKCLLLSKNYNNRKMTQKIIRLKEAKNA